MIMNQIDHQDDEALKLETNLSGDIVKDNSQEVKRMKSDDIVSHHIKDLPFD